MKNYWNSNAEFADLFNAVLFQGKQIIQPEDLESDDTDESTLQEHGDSVDSLNLFRDTIKICKKSEKKWHSICFVRDGASGIYSLCNADACNGNGLQSLQKTI